MNRGRGGGVVGGERSKEKSEAWRMQMHVPSWSQAQALSALAALLRSGQSARAEIIEAFYESVASEPFPKSQRGPISHATITTRAKLRSLFPRDGLNGTLDDTNAVILCCRHVSARRLPIVDCTQVGSE